MRNSLALSALAVLLWGCGVTPAAPTATPSPAVDAMVRTAVPTAVVRGPEGESTPDPLDLLFATAADAAGTPELAEGRIVDAHGRQMWIRCTGEGAPTVVLEGTWGSQSSDWDFTSPGIAEFTRVCVYDHAEPGDESRTIETLVADLNAMLGSAGVGGPYVLVGHDIGGLVVRLYAHRYPDEVAGMVLVDALHEDVLSQSLAGLPPEKPGEDAQLAERRAFLESLGDMEQVRAAGDLGDTPLVVLSQVLPTADGDVSPAVRRSERIWQEAQGELAELSSDSVHVNAETPRQRRVHREQPQLVVEAISQVVEAARTGEPLPPCEEELERLGGECVR
jgi:pimeloyl-ACP methyl ester carboxylesterase